MINGHVDGEAESTTKPYHKWHLILSPCIAANAFTATLTATARSVTVACFGESVCFHVGRDRQTYRTSLIEFICFWWQRVVISKTPFRLSSCCHTYECCWPVTEAAWMMACMGAVCRTVDLNSFMWSDHKCWQLVVVCAHLDVSRASSVVVVLVGSSRTWFGLTCVGCRLITRYFHWLTD